jgi:hypothetical protein
MTFTEFFTVHAIPPFDFDLSAKIFQSGDPQIPQLCKWGILSGAQNYWEACFM